MKKLNLLTILLVSFVLLGCWNKNTSSNAVVNIPNQPADTVTLSPNDDEDTLARVQDSAGKRAATGYATYNEAVLQGALDEGKKVALFFHASRCPNCVALNENIETNFTTIPADTMIFKVDYDTSNELKEKYSVTSQHTIVYIDEEMDAINKVVGPTNLDELLTAFAQ